MRRRIIRLAGGLLVLSLLALACGPAETDDMGATMIPPGDMQDADDTDEPMTVPEMEVSSEGPFQAGDVVGGREIMLDRNGIKYLVDPTDIRGGGPPKDGIPPIDDPKFVPLEEADEWIADNELVIAVTYKGEQRVYPLQIMVWHEIVNEVIGGDPLLITY